MKYAWVFAAFAAAVGVVPTQAGAQPARHVIIISVDGLHQADLNDPALKGQIPNILSLASSGVWYSNASGTTPSDSFPGTMAYLTGAGPAVTGVYYDDSYSRTLLAPGSPVGAAPGTPVQNTEVIDKDDTLINGGGNSGLESIDVSKLTIDPAHATTPAFPHEYLKVNTIFEIAHAAGLRTSIMDKHPAYEIAAGPSGKGLDDLYCPEIQAKGVLVDGKLLDSSTASSDTKLKGINKNVPLAMAYDDLKVAALVREIHGQDARGLCSVPAPGLVVINLQALNIAEKSKSGGIDLKDGQEVPSNELISALGHTDAAIGTIERELKSAGLWDQTLVILTAKHGQDPRVGVLTNIATSVVKQPLESAGIPLAAATLDDVGLFWLKNPAQAGQAAAVMQHIQVANNAGIDRVLWGDSLKAAKLAGPADRTPDVIVTLKPGYVFSDKFKRSEHGGFCADDTRVPVILAGGVIGEKHRGTTVDTAVKTTQIAVTTLDALGLDARNLQAQIENTQPLPGSGLESAAVAAAAKISN